MTQQIDLSKCESPIERTMVESLAESCISLMQKVAPSLFEESAASPSLVEMERRKLV